MEVLAECRSAFSCVQTDAIDPFDHVPDSVLLLVFNKLADIKALGRCCVVSKRFNNLVTQVENVVIKVDCVITSDENSMIVKGRGLLNYFVRLLIGTLAKPLQALQEMLGPKKAVFPEVSHHSPGEVLKNFKNVRMLRIELPGGELGIGEGIFLRWRAEFGSTLENCVIFGASSLVNYGKNWRLDSDEKQVPVMTEEQLSSGNAEGGTGDDDYSGSIPEALYTNGGLTLRVVWTISSLIAASARHYLLQQIVRDHPTLESVVLTDADCQGTLCMSKEQLQQFRSKPHAVSPFSNRTEVPAVKMNLWYAPYVDLPGRAGVEGATLVTIQPMEQSVCKESENLVSDAFTEPLNVVATALVKRRTYVLEMNSF